MNRANSKTLKVNKINVPEEIEIPAGMPEEENAETETEIAAETGDEAVLEAEEETVAEEVETEVAEEIETAVETEVEAEAAEAVEAVVEEQDDFGFFAPLEDPVSTTAPECINDEAAANIKPALMDVLLGKHAWKTDVPGPQVRNILSAISLNDRVLFINTLFGSNPMLFQETVSHLNSLENFTDAEEFISSNFSGWKFDSEPVYRFMMAIRRKLG